MSIDKNNNRLDIYDWNYTNTSILELKRWVDTQIEQGMNTVKLEISWGYYDDIDALVLAATK